MTVWAKQKGFTIVELLIVVVVIAILAAITIVAYNGIRQRAADSAAKSMLSQAQTKVKAYQVLNSAYPATLTDAGLGVDVTANVQYTVNTATDPVGMCLTATQSGTSAYLGENYSYNNGTIINQPNATSGMCPGHSPTGGTVIRNLIANPSFETGTTGWGGSNANFVQSNAWASSGSNSIRVTNAGTANAGDIRINSGNTTTMPFGMEAGKTYTVSARVQFGAAPTGNLGRAPGVLIWYSLNGSGWEESFGPKSPTAPGTYTVSHTVTLPANTTGVLIGLGVASTTAGQQFYYDSVMVTEGSTVYPFADGSSPNWVWTGAPNASSSTGPAL